MWCVPKISCKNNCGAVVLSQVHLKWVNFSIWTFRVMPISFHTLNSFFLCLFLEGRMHINSCFLGSIFSLLLVATLFPTFISSLWLKSYLGVSEFHLVPFIALFSFFLSGHPDLCFTNCLTSKCSPDISGVMRSMLWWIKVSVKACHSHFYPVLYLKWCQWFSRGEQNTFPPRNPTASFSPQWGSGVWRVPWEPWASGRLRWESQHSQEQGAWGLNSSRKAMQMYVYLSGVLGRLGERGASPQG